MADPEPDLESDPDCPWGLHNSTTRGMSLSSDREILFNRGVEADPELLPETDLDDDALAEWEDRDSERGSGSGRFIVRQSEPFHAADACTARDGSTNNFWFLPPKIPRRRTMDLCKFLFSILSGVLNSADPGPSRVESAVDCTS